VALYSPHCFSTNGTSGAIQNCPKAHSSFSDSKIHLLFEVGSINPPRTIVGLRF